MDGEPDRRVRVPPAGSWLRGGSRIACSSVEDLAAIWPSAAFSSQAVDFYATALALKFGDFEVETILSSAYTCVRNELHVQQFPRPAIAIEVILEGSVQRQQQGLDYTQRAGEAAVTLLDEPFSFTWSSPGRSVRTVAAMTLLPAEFDRPGAVRAGPLGRSALVNAYVGFLRGLVDVAQPSVAENRPLEFAALGLHRAVIVEALRPRASPAQGLRARIERHVDAHLSEVALSPTSVAADLGVSLRSVHGAFDGADLTLAAEIRRRRVLAAATLLQDDGSAATLSSISRRVGFSSVDRLRRSFVAVLGATPNEYRRTRLE